MYNEARVPETTRQTIDDYVQKGYEPDEFVEAVLMNDLREAAGRADINNYYALADVAGYVYNNVPHVAVGSLTAIQRWLEHKKKEQEEALTSESPPDS